MSGKKKDVQKPPTAEQVGDTLGAFGRGLERAFFAISIGAVAGTVYLDNDETAAASVALMTDEQLAAVETVAAQLGRLAVRARFERRVPPPGAVEIVEEKPASCICDFNPGTTDGPQIDCPIHGIPER